MKYVLILLLLVMTGCEIRQQIDCPLCHGKAKLDSVSYHLPTYKCDDGHYIVLDQYGSISAACGGSVK